MSAVNDPNSKIVHRYDDIEEEDNQLPNWWLFILFTTMVFMFGYWLVYHTTRSLQDPRTEYNAEIAELKKARLAQMPLSDEAILAVTADPGQVEEGKAVFASTCIACHLAGGQGLIGPNLTDKFWIHGNKPSDIARAVTEGYADKGMPPWGAVLGEAKVRKVAAYVVTLKNTNVPGKEPQGEPLE